MKFQAKQTNINERGNKVNITINTDDPEVMRQLLNMQKADREYMDAKADEVNKAKVKRTADKPKALAQPKKTVKGTCEKTSKTSKAKDSKKASTSPKKKTNKSNKEAKKKTSNDGILYDDGRFKIWQEPNGYCMYDFKTGNKSVLYFEENYQKALIHFKKIMKELK